MLNVICLKHGAKYGPEYVNKLSKMVMRHLTMPYRFVCFTDDASGLDSSIEIRFLPKEELLEGWWWKLYLFKSGHFAVGDTNLFFDLDTVIIKDISKLINFLPGEFVGLENLNRVFKRYPPSLGSAILRWPAETYTDIWDKFKIASINEKSLAGDQDWIWKLHKNTIKFFPSKWIISYKWEARDRSELTKHNNRFVFKEIKNPTIPKDTAVLAFHGSPDPHEVQDPIILENWK